MFMILLAKHMRMVLNTNGFFFFFLAGGEADQNLPYATIHWLKRLRICANAVGVDHRITVPKAVNQGISFYLGCPKSALVSL